MKFVKPDGHIEVELSDKGVFFITQTHLYKNGKLHHEDYLSLTRNQAQLLALKIMRLDVEDALRKGDL